ncbi:MAG: hypothetical protein QOH08_2443 [Chloroflexota bacterium]|nr:hypothetical protein [Chloroflexota bacterium]
MPKLPPQTLLVLAVTILVAGCGADPAPTARQATVFVVPTDLPNGRVEIAVSPSYALGAVATIPVAIVVTRGSVTGPVTARVLASGIGGGGAPAEVLVRELAVTPAVVGAAGRASRTLTWDTRDLHGAVVPAGAYTLVLELRSDDAGTSRTLTAGATLELR